jgi:hypothetical protein
VSPQGVRVRPTATQRPVERGTVRVLDLLLIRKGGGGTLEPGTEVLCRLRPATLGIRTPPA